MSNFKNYITAFRKYYLPNKPKLILTVILTVVVFFWVNKITNNILLTFGGHGLSLTEKIAYLGQIQGAGLYILFIKPLFVYISGLIIINKI